MKDFKKLEIWQYGFQIAVNSFKITETFPKYERWGLAFQINKAGVSIPSNIAEGQGRKSTKDFLRHLSISYGSLREAETQNLIAERLGYISDAQSRLVMEKCAEVGRLINPS